MCTGTGGFGEGGMSGTWSDKIIMASSMLSAFGNLQQGKQGANLYGYRADQAIADAAAERGAGAVRAGKVMKAGRFQQGEVTAAYGASGIDVGSGSAIAVKEQLQRNIGEDATAQLLTGERRARSLEAQAAMDRVAGTNSITSGRLAATRSLLTGAGVALDAQNTRNKWIKKTQAEQARTPSVGGGSGDFAE